MWVFTAGSVTLAQRQDAACEEAEQTSTELPPPDKAVSHTSKTSMCLLQGSVTLHGPKATMHQAMNVLKLACDEAEKTSTEQVLPLEPHRAALFTHPDLKQQGKQLVEGIAKHHRVVCHLDTHAPQSSVFHGIDVQASIRAVALPQ